MTAVRNHVAVPFFERVPTRAKEILLTTFDNIVDRQHSQKEAYYYFGNGVKKLRIEGPSFEEFAAWYVRVKNGLVDRPHPSEALHDTTAGAVDPYHSGVRIQEERLDRALQRSLSVALNQDTSDIDAQRLKHARGIVKAAHELNLAKLAAGFSPLSISLDDTIVQEALREVLSAEVTATVMDADVHMTPGNKLVDLLLGQDNEDIDAKLVDCLTIDMQAELCRIIVETLPAP